MSTGLKNFVIGAVLVAAAFIPPIAAIGALSMGLLSVGSGFVIRALFRPSGLTNKQLGNEHNSASLDSALPVVYGEARLGLRLVDMRVDASGFLYIVGALCHGSDDGSGIDSIREIYFDNQLAFDAGGTLQGFLKDKDGNGKATVTKYLGTDAQTRDSTLGTKFPTEWPSTSKGAGIAYVIIRLEFDPEVLSGIPNITAIVRGCKTFDPRDSSTIYNDNPILAWRDYMRSSRYGLNILAADIDDTEVQAEANYCEEQVNIDSGTQDRFRIGGWADVARSPVDNIRQILSSCRGQYTYEGGVYRPHIRRSGTSVMSIGESDIVGDWVVNTQGVRESPNRVRYTYLDGAVGSGNRIASKLWPRPGDANTMLTEDNNFESEVLFEQPFTRDEFQAEQIAMVMLREMRTSVTWAITCHEKVLKLRVWDIIALTHSTPAWTGKLFRVMGMEPVGDATIRLILSEYDVNAYSLDAQATFPSTPGTGLPDPFSAPPPTSLVLTSNDTTGISHADGTWTQRIQVGWTAPANYVFVDHYNLEYKKTADSNWITAPNISKDEAEAWIDPVLEGVGYDIRVGMENHLGRRSTWLTGSITPAAESTVPANVSGFAAVFDNNGNIALSWTKNSENALAGYIIKDGSGSWASASEIWRGSATFVTITRARILKRTYDFQIKAVMFNSVESASATTVSAVVDAAPNASVVDIAVDINDVAGTSANVILQVDVTGCNATVMNVYASNISGFTPSASNHVSTVRAKPGLDLTGLVPVNFSIHDKWLGGPFYLKFGFTDALTTVLSESEVLTAQFTSSGGVSGGGGGGTLPAWGPNLLMNGSPTLYSGVVGWGRLASLAAARIGNVIRVYVQYTVAGVSLDSISFNSTSDAFPNSNQQGPVPRKFWYRSPVDPAQTYQLRCIARRVGNAFNVYFGLVWLDDQDRYIAPINWWNGTGGTELRNTLNGAVSLGDSQCTIDSDPSVMFPTAPDEDASEAEDLSNNEYMLFNVDTNVGGYSDIPNFNVAQVTRINTATNVVYFGDSGQRPTATAADGTSVRRSMAGASYGYVAASNYAIGTAEEELTGDVGGTQKLPDDTSASTSAEMPPGTVSCFPLILMRNGTSPITLQMRDCTLKRMLTSNEQKGLDGQKIGADGTSKTFPEGTTIGDGGQPRHPGRGEQNGTAQHGDSIVFTPAYPTGVNPVVEIWGGITYQPKSKWGTKVQADTDAGTDAPLTEQQQEHLEAEALDVNGFDISALLKQKNTTITPVTITVWAPTSNLTAQGESADLDIGSLGGETIVDDQFTPSISVTIQACVATGPGQKPSDFAETFVQVRVQSNDGGGWITRITKTWTVRADGPGNCNDGGGSITNLMTIAGMGDNDDFRCLLSTITRTGLHGAGSSESVNPNSISYSTQSGGDRYTSKTPYAENLVKWRAYLD